MSTYRKAILATAAAATGMLIAVPHAVAGQAAQSEEKPQAIEATAAVLEGASMTLEVDGIVCPFCAYGLEKRLRELPALDERVRRVRSGQLGGGRLRSARLVAELRWPEHPGHEDNG